ncbi:MAG: hypothetical protein ABSB58_06845 [Gemmatimonadales bacterium]|jgi:hypothetical protein
MSADRRRERTDLGGMTRRELVSALARWTVPTVLTLSLGARSAYAAASCPPCTKKTSGVCRACTVSQILNCQCEPCLGAPYCPNGPRTAAFRPAPSTSLNGSLNGPAPAGDRALETYLRQRANRLDQSPLLPGFGTRADSMARGPFGRTLFAPDRRPSAPRGLYDRLRPFDGRR